MNATVEHGGYFEVRNEQISPRQIADGFRGIFCGYKTIALIQLAKWDFFVTHSLMVDSVLPEDYQGRITIRNKTNMRISNAKFADEGRNFYCTLDYHNLTTGLDLSITKFVKLESVYGKRSI